MEEKNLYDKYAEAKEAYDKADETVSGVKGVIETTDTISN